MLLIDRAISSRAESITPVTHNATFCRRIEFSNIASIAMSRNYDALPGAGHRCSRRVGPGDYSVRREGRPGAAKVRRPRDFPSEGKTIACPRRRGGPRRRAKTRLPEQTEPLCMSQCWMRWPEWPKRVAPEIIAGASLQITIAWKLRLVNDARKFKPRDDQDVLPTDSDLGLASLPPRDRSQAVTQGSHLTGVCPGASRCRIAAAAV